MKSLRFWGLGIALVVAVLAVSLWILRAPTPTAGDELALGTPALCAAYSGLPPDWQQRREAGMRRIDGGEFVFGSDRGYPDERPVVHERVSGFWIDRTEVTNAQFAAFVDATGYVTLAEREGAAVFQSPEGPVAEGRWWRFDEGANWRQPEGAGSDLNGRANQPVVQVVYEDAQAYAQWLGRDLPTEREWEFAAKAGRDNERSDASLRDAQRRPLANFWQGLFPYDDRAEDGYPGRAPVGCFPANPNGLYDTVGNVWEWTSDPYTVRSHAATVPAGGVEHRVIKGGSWLCSADYCMRARASSRQGQEVDLPISHVGFRTVLRD